eukprot:scaffold54421_cov57-Attheya_sp.AAC.2
MKSKDRVTLMIICTAADGTKVPLSIIGKAKKTECFHLCENDKVPLLAYKGQRNAWFDKEVTMWWLLVHVFWPHHLQVHGDVPCLLLLDNASVQTNLDLSVLPANLHMMYVPPNVTNMHQPADMGMIASLKQAAVSCGRQQRGCKGLAYGGKAHILDAMNILDSIWGQDGKYAYNDSIQWCWRKSDILPSTWMMDINNDVRSASMSNKLKRISDEEDCNDLCSSSMKNLLTKSFDDSELRAMYEEWVDVESDEEAIEQLESEKNTTNDYDYISDLYEDDMSDDDELLPPISFTDAMDSFEKLKHYGLSSLGVPSDDLERLNRLEQQFQMTPLSNKQASSQPTLTSFFKN